MGFANVFFIQAIVGCVDLLPQNEYCIAIFEEMKRIGENGGFEVPPQEKKSYSKPWADFVQAVIDRKIDDPICKSFFNGATVFPCNAQADQYDFSISQRAFDETTMEGKFQDATERFGKVMEQLLHQ